MSLNIWQRIFGGLRPNTRRAAHQAPLAVEHLEDRVVMSADVNAAFVASAYHTLLNRAPSPDELSYWSAQVQNNGQQSVMAGIEASPEHQSVEVRNLYDTILGRQARPDEVNYWLSLMQSGASADTVKADILGSGEYFQRAGNSPSTFVNSLYQNDLGRSADPGGVNYWDSLLSQGASRSDVAQQILSSPEALNNDVEGAYSLYLGRPADPSGVSYWSDQIASDPSLSATDVLLAGLMGSGEGVSRLSTFDTSPTMASVTDPNVVASNYLTNAFNTDWNLPTTNSALSGWSAVGYDPWLPTTFDQTPVGGSNWSSYIGSGSLNDATFWNSIGADYFAGNTSRPVSTYNDAAGYQTTPSTASSIANYADGNNIRIFPGEYLSSNDGSGWTTDTGSNNNVSIGYDDNAPKGGYPSGTVSYGSNSDYSSYDPYGSSSSSGYDPYSSSSSYSGQSWSPSDGTDLLAGQDVPIDNSYLW
jgi:hypothetical protein